MRYEITHFVSLSARYNKITKLKKQLTIIDLKLNPSMDFLFLKKLMSFLKAKMSNTVCSIETIAVTARRYGFVSNSMVRNISFE